MGEQDHIEGETLGQWRARHGLPGTDTGAARAVTWRDGMWRNEHGGAATSTAEPNLHDEIRARSFLPAVPCAKCGANVARWIDGAPGRAACNGCGAEHDEERPRREDAVGLVREPFVPSAKASAETLEVLARSKRGAIGDADELARLLLALRPAIPLVLGWFAVSSPAYRLARAVELLTRERERLTKRVAELEAAGRVTASLAKDFAAQAAAEQSVRNWLRAHGHDLTRPWDEVVIGLLEAPPAGSVAGLDHLIRVIVSDARDWSTNRTDAWIYGTIVGWGDALSEVAERNGWSEETTRRLESTAAIVRSALGHAAGALSREGEVAALREEVAAERGIAGELRAMETEALAMADRWKTIAEGKGAEIARLTAELAEAERLMGAAIDNAAADRERALDAEAKLATARADGARKEREACAKLCDDAEPCINPADLAYAIRARGDQ